MFQDTEQTRTYPCGSCGDDLVFDPASQQLRSPSCGRTYPITVGDSAQITLHDLGSTMAELERVRSRHDVPVSTEREIVCQSCGGHTMFSGTLTATRCPYCNTAIQRDDVQASEVHLPVDAVLPLRVGEKHARDEIEKWINSRWFAPTEFKKYKVLGSFTSIYMSYFSYDAEATTRYVGERGDEYQVRDDDGNTQTRVRWRRVSGVVHDSVDDLTEIANTGMHEGHVRALEPWPIEEAAPFTPEFVAGHLSRTYDLDAGQVFEQRARGRIDQRIDQTIRRDIGGDQQRVHDRQTYFDALGFIYVLLPIWLLTVTYAGKPFQVFVNGMTGEVQGARPWSKVKIAIAAVITLLVLSVAAYLYVTYGSSSSGKK